MKTAKLATDLKITLLEKGKICRIEIDNPEWNWMMCYLSNKKTVNIEWEVLKNTDEKFWREFISNTYYENKKTILEAKMNNFQTY